MAVLVWCLHGLIRLCGICTNMSYVVIWGGIALSFGCKILFCQPQECLPCQRPQRLLATVVQLSVLLSKLEGADKKKVPEEERMQ